MKRGVPHTIRAEQALLGAVLSDPAGQAHLLELVNAEDMTRPYHAQVLQAMQRLRGRGVVPAPVAVYQEVQKDPDMPRLLSRDGVPLADLMEASPRSAHAPAYAAMVIDTGIRRRIELAASRLKQAARSGNLADALHMAAEARRELGQCRARWEALPDEMQRELPTPIRTGHAAAAQQLRLVRDEIRQLRQDLTTEPQHTLEDRLASIAQHVAEAAASSATRNAQQQPTPPQPHPQRPEADAAGARTLRELAANPSHIVTVRAWLHPEHFTRPAYGDLYAVMRDLHAAGKPVDPVTVSWEASRRGLHADAADLANGTGAFAVASAREVHHHGLLTQATQASQDIQADASDPTASATQVIRSATDRLHRLDPSPARPNGQPHQQPVTTRNGHARAPLHPEQAPVEEPIAEAVP